jgi:membrane dipeptidase
MLRLVVNLQGSLANPNVALEAAKRGDLATLSLGATSRIDDRAAADALAAGLGAMCVTVGHVVGDGDAVSRTWHDLREWQAFLAHRDPVFLQVRSAADLERLAAAGRCGVIFGFQNTEMLAGNPAAVDEFARVGVRVMQLTYNTPNAVGCGCLSPHDQGLSTLGAQVVEAMNESGVLVDASHASPRTLREAIATSARPIAVSHTACRSLVDHPRHVSDDDLRRLADRGGVVGIYAMPFLRASGQPTLDDYVRHIGHALNVAGAEHVGIGTDGTVTAVDDVAAYRQHLREAVQGRRVAGVSAPGEDEAVLLFLPDMAGPGQFDMLARRLEQHGHAASTIDKLLGLNWLRLARDVWP